MHELPVLGIAKCSGHSQAHTTILTVPHKNFLVGIRTRNIPLIRFSKGDYYALIEITEFTGLGHRACDYIQRAVYIYIY